MGLEQSGVPPQIGHRARVGLDVGVIGLEDFLGPFLGEFLDQVGDLLAFVVAFAGVALGVLVGQALDVAIITAWRRSFPMGSGGWSALTGLLWRINS